MSKHVVSVANDLTVVAPTMHMGVVIPGPLPTVEVPAIFDMPGARAIGKRRLADRVRHRGQAIVQLGHDLGPGLAHVCVPPDPLASAKHTAASSRRVVHGATRVLAQGLPVGACTLSWLPPTPMVACSEPVDLPLCDAPTSHFNSVVVGLG